MRPWSKLGYDRDRIALYMMRVEAFSTAESEFRRAIWLNPFEWRFKYHLAWCLFRQKKYKESRELTDGILRVRPDEPCCLELLPKIEAGLRQGKHANGQT